MKSRNLTIDIARGFIVLIMPATHVTLYYGSISVHEGLWGGFLRCFAEGAGAQLFMFLLGFSFFLGRERSIKFIVKRSVSIFFLAYLLNFFKLVLPSMLGLIPGSFFEYYHLNNDVFGMIDLLMVGDIFQFAALSYLVCGILHQFKSAGYIALGLVCLITVASPFLWGRRIDNFLLDYGLKLFNGYPPAVFFPFFPWIIYPLLGLAFGWLFKQKSNTDFYRICLITGIVCILFGVLGMQYEPTSYNKTFYRLGPSGSILHCGLVLLWLYLCHFIAGKMKQRKHFVQMITWCSINITFVYICQWVVIAWLFPLFGFMDLGLAGTLMAVVVISSITFLMVACAKLYKKRLNNPKSPQPPTYIQLK